MVSITRCCSTRSSCPRCDPPPLACVLWQGSLCIAVALFVCASPNDKVMCWRLRLALALLAMSLAPIAVATALQGGGGTGAAGVETGDGASVSFDADTGDGASVSFDASPLMNVSAASLSHVTRRLVQINVQPGAGTLQAALDAASNGDELVLANGTYTGSGSNGMLTIGKSITIRALHAHGAILDGQNARRVVYITSGTVVLEGLDITGGHAADNVRLAFLARSPNAFQRQRPPPLCLLQLLL